MKSVFLRFPWRSLLQHWSRRASFVTIGQTWQNLDAIALYWVREEMINNCMWLNLWGIHWQKVGGAAVKHVHVGGHEDVHDAYVVGHCVITVNASLLTRTGSVKSKSRSRWFHQHYCTGAKCQASLCGDFVVPIVHDFKVGRNVQGDQSVTWIIWMKSCCTSNVPVY